MPVEIQLTELVIPYVLSAIVAIGLALYGLREYRRTGWKVTTVIFLGIVISIVIWSVARTFETIFVSETLTQFWIAILYFGYGGVTMGVLLFALAFTGKKQLLTRRNVALIFIFPAIAVILAFTNEYHELLWVGEMDTYTTLYSEITVYRREFQPLFFVYLAYTTIGGVLIGLIILLRNALQSPDVYRQQSVAFIIGSVSALLFGILFATGNQPFVPDFVDLTPVGYTIMISCFAFAIFRYQMLDLVPVARDTVIESMRDGYLVLDTDDRIVDLNNAAKETIGASDEIVGSSVHEELPECSSGIEGHEHGTQTETEVRLESEDEQLFLMVAVSSLYDDEKLIGRLLFLRDVTEQRAVQKRFQALIENSSDLILVTELDGEITYASPSVEPITGVRPKEIIGMNAFDLVHDEDRPSFESTVAQLRESPGEKTRFEYRTYDADGSILFMEASVWNLLDNPFVEGIVVNAREITERKKREREIREKNTQLEKANNQLEQFARVISHDLRNPINVARGHLDLARDTGREESYDKIGDSLERMEAIIDDVLTLARQGESIGETERVELAERAERGWEHVATDEAELVVTENASFEADPDRLLQLLENLFRNAHEHVGEDVTVRVGVDNGAMYVEDDGPGIPEDKRDTVLESGHTTNQDGTGLGLSIVSQIAEAHDWEVDVTEGSDGGARFEFPGIDHDES